MAGTTRFKVCEVRNKDEVIHVRVSFEEKRDIMKAVELQNRSVSDYVRSIVVRNARQILRSAKEF